MWKVLAEECRRAEVHALEAWKQLQKPFRAWQWCVNRSFLTFDPENLAYFGAFLFKLLLPAQEWKLRETRRRHIDELARLSSQPELWAPEIAPPLAVPPSRPGDTGPVLVSSRRDCGAHRIRLWIEDLGSLSSARLHAVDEATGARVYRDMPDAALSRLLSVFQSPSCDPDDVDDFLRALLAACKIRMFPGGLDLILPTEKDLQARPPPLNMRVMQHISAMRPPPPKAPPIAVAEPPAPRPRVPRPVATRPAPRPAPRAQAPVQIPERAPRPTGRPLRRRPQSAPHTGREDEPRKVAPPLTFSRRARPTSAKALKHRRVVDDSVDSIIYEDDEEEQEEVSRWPSHGFEEPPRPSSSCDTPLDPEFQAPGAAPAAQCLATVPDKEPEAVDLGSEADVLLPVVLEDFTALASAEPRASSPPPRPEKPN